MTSARSAHTRDRLLRAATELIAEGGYAAASVGAIAERTGLARGALYRHFPSKEVLFAEVLRTAARNELSLMRAASGRSARFAARFEGVIRMYATSTLRNRRLAWALAYEPADSLVDAERLAYRRRYRDGMAGLLRDGIAEQAIPDQDVQVAAAAVIGAIAEALAGPLSPTADRDGGDDDLVTTIIRFCRRAVGLD